MISSVFLFFYLLFCCDVVSSLTVKGVSRIISCQGNLQLLQQASQVYVDAVWPNQLSRDRDNLIRTQFREFRLRYAGREREGDMLVCCQEKQVVACIGLDWYDIVEGDRKPLLSNLAVATECRRQGIARKLIKEVEGIIKDEWHQKHCYLSVNQYNLAAVKLYRKSGYKVVRRDVDGSINVPGRAGNLQPLPSVILWMRKPFNFWTLLLSLSR
mmetsp:Transcript_27396/g.41475  ORF Transcript_27396/g.41475 Transcript_27396/m.41475 type:complete len:213 (+) Transcript_27396:108-746(+)